MYGPPNLGTNVSVAKSTTQQYHGDHDQTYNLRDGEGSMNFYRADYMQNYEGSFLWDNMHGQGKYQWHTQPPKHTWEGQMYVNKKDGYGRLSYPCGSNFEGLFREDTRFGPGVYTDEAGYQDVGIWVDSKLIRLARSLKPDFTMPRLATTDEARIRILQYREMIHLGEDQDKYFVRNLLDRLSCTNFWEGILKENVLARADELYNPFCKDTRAPWLNKPKYEEAFFGNETEFTIEVLLTEEEILQKMAEEKEFRRQTEELKQREPERIASNQELLAEREEVEEKEKSGPIAKKYSRDTTRSLKKGAQIKSQSTAEKQREDEDDDVEEIYCGIPEVDEDHMSETFQTGNHEDQWNVFQSSAVYIPHDSPPVPDEKPSENDKLEENEEQDVTIPEFDEFGRIKITPESPTKRIIVTDLLAWNNNPLMIELLKHVFKHRNFEKDLTYDIGKLLAGRRGAFRQEGAHERAALEMLCACSGGFVNRILRLIVRQNLDVDVADSRGNTGLMFAAARDRLEVIDALLDVGAEIDCINDECLTPLSLCVLRTLELIHGVIDWTEGFLPPAIILSKDIVPTVSETNVDDVISSHPEQWHGRISYLSLAQQEPMKMDWILPLPHRESQGNVFEDGRGSMEGESIEGETEIKKGTTELELEVFPPNALDPNQQVEQEVARNIELYWDTRDICYEGNTIDRKVILEMLCQSINKMKEVLDPNYDVTISQINIPTSPGVDLEDFRLRPLSRISQSDSSRIMIPARRSSQRYIFDMTPIVAPARGKGAMDKNAKDSKNPRKGKEQEASLMSTSVHVAPSDDINQSIIDRKKNKIFATILKLLDRGADPNLSSVPYPVLIMAMFTKELNLVTELLSHRADPDVCLRKEEYSLTPLHILTILKPSLENTMIARALVNANANLHLRTDHRYRTNYIFVAFRMFSAKLTGERFFTNTLYIKLLIQSAMHISPDIKENLTANRSPEFIDNEQGLTMLHLLAARPDYKTDGGQRLAELLKVIIQEGCADSGELYQGHSPLALAIMEGNIPAVKAFLQTSRINVNQQLGPDIGSCMLMLESGRVQQFLPAPVIQEILEVLLENGGCPFASATVLNKEYNLIEYGRQELDLLSNPTVSENSDVGKGKKQDKKKPALSPAQRLVTQNFAQSMNFVEKVAREKLNRRIKANFVIDMMRSHSTMGPPRRRGSRSRDPCSKHAANWMSGEELATVMRTMEYSRETIKDILSVFVRTRRKSSSGFKAVNTDVENILRKVITKSSLTRDVWEDTEFIKMEDYVKVCKPIGLYPPENDPDLDKYKVCFECLYCHDKVLVPCGECYQVYFCSEICNEKNTKRTKNPHKCPVFYEKQRRRLESIAAMIGMNPTRYMLSKVMSRESYVGSMRKSGDKTYHGRHGRRKSGTESKSASSKKQEEKTKRRGSRDRRSDSVDSSSGRDGKRAKREKNDKSDRGSADETDGGRDRGKGAKGKRKRDSSGRRRSEDSRDSNVDGKGEGKGRNKAKGKRGSKGEGDISDDSDRNDGRSGKGKKGDKGGRGKDYDSDGDDGRGGKGKKGGRGATSTGRDDDSYGGDGKVKPRTAGKNAGDFDDVRNKKKGEQRKGDDGSEGDENQDVSGRRAKKEEPRDQSNMPEKHVQYLLKVCGSAAEGLDFDMLMLPYVVFAQGDMYYRIVPTNTDAKFVENYSLN